MLENIESFVSLIRPFHLWLIFALTLIYAIPFSFMLIFHWKNYGTNSRTIILAETIYLLVIGFLLVAITITISLFSSII